MGRMEKVKLSKNTNVAQYRRMEVEKDREGIARFLRERFDERYFMPLERSPWGSDVWNKFRGRMNDLIRNCEIDNGPRK